ncbi:MAG: hypothetical protein AAFN92_16470, partial [Bacteroidota bacterium]
KTTPLRNGKYLTVMKNLLFLCLLLSTTAYAQYGGDGSFKIPTLNDVLPREEMKYDPIIISTDAGKSWQPLSAGLPDKSRASAIAEGPRGDLWIGTDKEGIYHLPARTEEWQKRSAGLPANADLNSIAVRGERLVAGTFRKGIYYSQDYGKTWRSPVFNVPNISVRALLFLTDSEVLAGTDDGLYYSTDGGENCSLRTASAQINDLYLHAGTLYIARADGLYASQDCGETTGPAELNFAVGEVFANAQHLYVLPTGGDIFRRPLGTVNWENKANKKSACMIVTDDLSVALWEKLHESHVSCGKFRPVSGLSNAVGFRRLLATKRAWVAAVIPMGC